MEYVDLDHARSFPPLANPAATTLILGSMPGQASLAAHQYYAHPRNAFWPIMGQLVGAHPSLDYEARVGALLDARIALWDVLGACLRRGSLDSNIEREGLVVNDFHGFLADHPAISRIFFNGAKAAQLFETLVQPALGDRQIARQRLPSTSPAHAGMKFPDKLAAWRQIVEANVGI